MKNDASKLRGLVTLLEEARDTGLEEAAQICYQLAEKEHLKMHSANQLGLQGCADLHQARVATAELIKQDIRRLKVKRPACTVIVPFKQEAADLSEGGHHD